MRVVCAPEARSYIVRHGGSITVTARSQRCCTGALTTLGVALGPPPDPSSFERLAAEDFLVYFKTAFPQRPDDLVIKLKGARRPKLSALWDGCAYVI
jgi:hypothetical protein